MRLIIVVCGVLFAFVTQAQSNVDSLLRAFYIDLNSGDEMKISAFFHKHALIKHIGDNDVLTLDLKTFLQVAPKFKSKSYQEEVRSIDINYTATDLIYADVEFSFFIDGKFNHMGMDHFCFSKMGEVLKIESIYSSQYKGTQFQNVEKVVDSLMLKWHADIATLNAGDYFGFMDSTFIFLGTDPHERWNKEDFKSYTMPHVKNGKTWTFTTNWRNWYFSKDGNTAWFEESLNTQMEECRGSGVLLLQEGVWSIAQYNLSVTIENEKMKDFILLRQR